MSDTTLFERHSDSFTTNIGLYYCGKRLSTPNHVYGPEIRSHFLLTLVEKGNATLYSKKGAIDFGEGQMLVMFPGEQIFYKAHTNWTIRWVGVTGDQVERIFSLLGVTRANPIWTPPSISLLSDLMEQLYVLQSSHSPLSQYKTQAVLCDLFAHMLSTLNSENTITNPVDVAKEIIHYNYNNNLAITELAKKVFLDPAYFSRLFKQETGLSPKEYVTKIRLEKAKKLLRSTNYSIKNISISVGYQDALYFSRLFVKNENCSPSDYRKLAKKQDTI